MKSTNVDQLLSSTDISTPFANCTTGEARLVSGVESSTTRSGRLELCINNAWGTVCDTSFDSNDAAVACSQVTGFSRNGNNLLDPAINVVNQ